MLIVSYNSRVSLCVLLLCICVSNTQAILFKSDITQAIERKYCAIIASNTPQALDETITTVQDTEVTLNVLTNDRTDIGTIVLVEVGKPKHGIVACAADGNCTYTPNRGFVGIDTFTYTISASQGGSSTATVTVIVEEPRFDEEEIQPEADIIPGQLEDDDLDETVSIDDFEDTVNEVEDREDIDDDLIFDDEEAQQDGNNGQDDNNINNEEVPEDIQELIDDL